MRVFKNSYVSMAGWGIFLAGALSLASCTGDETIDAIKGEAITFGNAFVENSTRATDPSYGAEKPIDQFKVWGTVTGNTGNTVNVFNGATVTKGEAAYGTAWSCNQTQYWIPEATYHFMAIAHGEIASYGDYNMPTAISYTADGSTDLLLGELTTKGIKEVKTDGAAEPTTGVTENKVVDFTMSHLLSKVVFTFNNIEANAELTVNNIQISGLHKTGTYTIADNAWTSSETADPLSFGGSIVEAGKSNTCDNERLIIPGTYDITITFTVTDNKGGQPQDMTATIEEQVFAIGNSYNFTADIKSGLTYIVFKIESTDWTEGSDNPIQG